MRFHIPPVWRRDGVVAGFVLREQYVTRTDVLTREGLGPDGEPVTEEVFVDSVVPSLTPLLSRGVAWAQGVMWRPASSPTVPAAPANALSYLHWNSSTGLYWNGALAPATAGDALIGWVRTDGAGVIVTSSRVLGNGAESTIPAPGVAVAGAGSDAIDTAVPDAPTFGVQAGDLDSTVAEVNGLAMAANAHSVSVAEVTFYFVDLAAADYLLGSSLTSGATSLVCASAPTTILAGDYVQVGAEIMGAGARTGSTLGVLRAQLGSTAASAAAGDVVSRVTRKTFTVPFAPGFFDTPAALDHVIEASLPETRLVAVRVKVTNAYGDAESVVCVSGGAGFGITLTAAAPGGAGAAIRDVTNADATLTAGEEIVRVTATTRDCVITLPAAASMQGLRKALQLSYGSTFAAKFRRVGSDTIAGTGSDYVITDPGSSVTVMATGTDWVVVSGVGSLTAPTVPDAENVDSSTSVAVEYGLYGNASAYALTASIVLPSSRPNLKEIRVLVDGPGGTLVEMGGLQGPWASSPVAWRSGDANILQGAAAVTRTVMFVCKNAANQATASPVTKTVTVRASAVTGFTSAGETGSRFVIAANNDRQPYLTISFVPILNGGQVPQTVSYGVSDDNGATWTPIGWERITAVGQTVSFTRVAPAAAGTWKVYAAAGALDYKAAKIAALPSGAVASAGFAVAAIAAPASSTGITATVGAFSTVQRRDGTYYGSIPAFTATDPTSGADVSFYLRVVITELDASHNPISARKVHDGWQIKGPGVSHTTAQPLDIVLRSGLAGIRYEVFLASKLSSGGGDFADATTNTLQTLSWNGGSPADHYDVMFGSVAADAIPGTIVSDVPAPTTGAMTLSCPISDGATTPSGVITYCWDGVVANLPTTNYAGCEITVQYAGSAEGGAFARLTAGQTTFHNGDWPRPSANIGVTFRAYPVSRDGVRGTPAVYSTTVTAAAAYLAPVVPAPSSTGFSISATFVQFTAGAFGVATFGWAGTIVRPTDLTNYNGCHLAQLWPSANETDVGDVGATATAFGNGPFTQPRVATYVDLIGYPVSRDNQRGTPFTFRLTIPAAGTAVGPESGLYLDPTTGIPVVANTNPGASIVNDWDFNLSSVGTLVNGSNSYWSGGGVGGATLVSILSEGDSLNADGSAYSAGKFCRMYGQTSISQSVGVSPGTAYNLRFKCRSSAAGSDITICIFWQKSDRTTIGSNVNAGSVSGYVPAWVYGGNTTLIAPTNAVYMLIMVYTNTALLNWDLAEVIVTPTIQQTHSGQTGSTQPTAVGSLLSGTSGSYSMWLSALLLELKSAGADIVISTGAAAGSLSIIAGGKVFGVSVSAAGTVISVDGSPGYTGSVTGRSCKGGIVI